MSDSRGAAALWSSSLVTQRLSALPFWANSLPSEFGQRRPSS